MRFVFDIDGVFAQYNLNYARLLRRITGKDLFPKGWMRDPSILSPCWDWELFWGYSQDDRDKAFSLITAPGSKFWEQLQLMPYAKDSLYCINNFIKTGAHDVYFLTQRPGFGAKFQTERWLYAKGIAYPTVITVLDAREKPLFLKNLGADVFIDDKIETVKLAIGCAKRVYLKDALYNRELGTTIYTRVKHVKEMLQREGLWKESEIRKAMFWRN